MARVSEYKPHGQGLEKVLGGLESRIMDSAWDLGTCTVRDVYERLRTDKNLAYTTVMTVMSRLASKGLLERNMVEGTYFYEPAVSRDEFRKSIVGEVVDSLLESFSDETMAHLVSRASALDADKLDKLADAILKRRKGETE